MKKCELKITAKDDLSVEAVEEAGGFEDRVWMLDLLMELESADWTDVLGLSSEELVEKVKTYIRGRFRTQVGHDQMLSQGNRVAHILAEYDPKGGGMHVTELMNHLGISRSAAESASRRLIAKGFAERVAPGHVRLIVPVEEVDAADHKFSTWAKTQQIPGTNFYAVVDPATGARFTCAPINVLKLLSDHGNVSWEQICGCFGTNSGPKRIKRELRKIERTIPTAWEYGKGVIADRSACEQLLDRLGVPRERAEEQGDDRSLTQIGFAFACTHECCF